MAPYTLQQMESLRGTIAQVVKMARMMLHVTNLLYTHWVDAVNTATYICNRCNMRVIKCISPEELWSGYKLNVSHMRVFGCKAYALINGYRHNLSLRQNH